MRIAYMSLEEQRTRLVGEWLGQGSIRKAKITVVDGKFDLGMPSNGVGIIDFHMNVGGGVSKAIYHFEGDTIQVAQTRKPAIQGQRISKTKKITRCGPPCALRRLSLRNKPMRLRFTTPRLALADCDRRGRVSNWPKLLGDPNRQTVTRRGRTMGELLFTFGLAILAAMTAASILGKSAFRKFAIGYAFFGWPAFGFRSPRFVREHNER
jgi:hypothetical protein